MLEGKVTFNQTLLFVIFAFLFVVCLPTFTLNLMKK